jgi:signal transduction histidine kinase
MFITTKPRGAGTGLGLAMVNRVTRDLGGRIQLDSEPGRGTRVRILLPAPPGA